MANCQRCGHNDDDSVVVSFSTQADLLDPRAFSIPYKARAVDTEMFYSLTVCTGCRNALHSVLTGWFGMGNHHQKDRSVMA